MSTTVGIHALTSESQTVGVDICRMSNPDRGNSYMQVRIRADTNTISFYLTDAQYESLRAAMADAPLAADARVWDTKEQKYLEPVTA